MFLVFSMNLFSTKNLSNLLLFFTKNGCFDQKKCNLLENSNLISTIECDLVQRGGTLVRGRGFADMVAALNAGVASSSSAAGSSTGTTPKSSKMTYENFRNKFCFGKL